MKINLLDAKYWVLVIYSVTVSLNCLGQERWEWQHPEPLGATPRSVQIIDENTVYFVASAGVFYKTTDAGETWEVSYFNTLSGSQKPQFLNAQVGYIASSDGKVFKTIDAGNTWEMVYEDTNEFQFTAINFYDENNGIVAAHKSYADSKVLITNDGGENWEVFDSGSSEDADSVFYTGGIWDVNMVSVDTIYARGGGEGTHEAFYRTYDGGESWETFEISVENDPAVASYMEALEFVNDTVGFVAGPGGGIFKTVNGGESWKRVNSQVEGANYYLNDIFFLDEQHGWVSGYDNQYPVYNPAPLFYTNDGGETWTEIDWVDDERFLDQIAYYDENLGYAIGRTNGGVYRTTNGGSSWQPLFDAGIRGSLISIDAVDNQNAWVVGAEGAILATTNGGEDWSIQSSDALGNLRDVLFLDAQQGWAVGDSGTVITTTNGGETWTVLETGVNENLRNINMVSSSDGFIVGDSSLMLKTVDGGASWESVNLFPDDTLQLNSLVFINDSTGWLGGEEGTIMHTTDGGENWNPQQTDLLGYDINDFFFQDENNGWAVCSGGTSNVFGRIIKTEDGGATWEQVPTNFTYAFYEIHFVSATKGWIAGYGFGGNNLLITNDGGETWNTDTNLRTTGTINAIDFVNEGKGWAVGGLGSILKYTNPIPFVADFAPKNGAVGTEVTITGEYFTDAISVRFNDVEADFTVQDDNTIKAIVPNTTDGSITVVTAQGSGTSAELFEVEIATSIEDAKFSNSITIYPNPNNGAFKLQITGLSSQVSQATITMHNSVGKVINEKTRQISNGNMSVDYNATALSTGLYIIKINTGREIVQKKLLVE